MPEIKAPLGRSIHPELKLAFICRDGETGFRLQIKLPDERMFVWPLDRARLATLLRQLCDGLAGDIENPAPPGRDLLAAPGERPVDLAIDGTVLTVAGRSIALKGHEGEVMAALIRNWGRPVHRERLFHVLYSGDPDGGPQSRALDVFICRLRKMLAGSGLAIATHWGIGWALVPERREVL
jgi:DNA-binding response OmpR family regulator